MLGLGLGIWRKSSSGAAAFTPASLFTGGYSGDWWEASTANLFVDRDGVTPVTTAGDAVGRWVGNVNATVMRQPTDTAGLKPIYRSGGYVQTDGVDDFLEAALSITGAPLTLAMCFDKSNLNSGNHTLSMYAAVGEYRSISVSYSAAGNAAERSTANVSTSPLLSYTPAAGLLSGWGIFTASQARFFFQPGTEATVAHSNTHAAAAVTYFGKQRASSVFGQVKAKHILVINRELSATDITNLLTYWGSA